MAATRKDSQRANRRGASRTPHPARTARVVFGVASGATYVGLAATIGWAANVEGQTNAEAADAGTDAPGSLALIDDLFAGAAMPGAAADLAVGGTDSVLPLGEVTTTVADPSPAAGSAGTAAVATTPAAVPTSVVPSASPSSSGPASTQSPAGQSPTSQLPNVEPAGSNPPSSSPATVAPSSTNPPTTDPSATAPSSTNPFSTTQPATTSSATTASAAPTSTIVTTSSAS